MLVFFAHDVVIGSRLVLAYGKYAPCRAPLIPSHERKIQRIM
jgi:hypothetical protein